MNKPKTNRHTTGEAMREARKEAGLSQAALGRMAGLSHNILCNYERDQCSPTLYNIIALADVLGITIDEYVGHRVKTKKEDPYR